MVRHAEGTHNVNRDYKSIEQFDARLTPFGSKQCRELRDELLLVKDAIVNKKYRDGDDTTTNGSPRNSDNIHRQGLEQLMGGLEKLQSDEDNDSNRHNDICVVVSPLTRCIETALTSFDFFPILKTTMEKLSDSSNNNNKYVPFVGLEALRETVNYNCDRRRRISEVANDFPQIDFSFCKTEEDEIWLSYRQQEKEQERTILSENIGDGNLLVDVQTPRTKKNYLESAQLYAVANRGRQAMGFIESLPQSKIVICSHSAYLRCILNWGQTGGVPKMFDQILDNREDPARLDDKLFEYCFENDESANESTDDSSEQRSELDRASFEEYMREDYGNAELRSFCLLVQ